MSEQLLNEILQKLNSMDNRMNDIEKDIQTIKTEMATKTDIKTIFGEQQKDVLAMLQIMDSKLDDIFISQESISEILGRHEVQIMKLRKRPV